MTGEQIGAIIILLGFAVICITIAALGDVISK